MNRQLPTTQPTHVTTQHPHVMHLTNRLIIKSEGSMIEMIDFAVGFSRPVSVSAIPKLSVSATFYFRFSIKYPRSLPRACAYARCALAGIARPRDGIPD